jgi:hypothetical protein
MDSPNRELDVFGAQGFVPRQNMLIDGVDQGPIEIEQESVRESYAGPLSPPHNKNACRLTRLPPPSPMR